MIFIKIFAFFGTVQVRFKIKNFFKDSQIIKTVGGGKRICYMPFGWSFRLGGVDADVERDLVPPARGALQYPTLNSNGVKLRASLIQCC
jgi:hypothetical protein